MNNFDKASNRSSGSTPFAECKIEIEYRVGGNSDEIVAFVVGRGGQTYHYSFIHRYIAGKGSRVVVVMRLLLMPTHGAYHLDAHCMTGQL